MEFLAGKLLVAIPELPDSNFYRSVVFVIDHTDEGAMGVILNRPSNVPLSELWQNIDVDDSTGLQANVHVGGPVNGPVLGFHNRYSISDNEVLDGIYLTMSSDRLNELVESKNIQLKVFSGYSGWGPGQLETELECGGWLVADSRPTDIFAEPESLWKDICERFGQKIMLPHDIKDRHQGDPNLN